MTETIRGVITWFRRAPPSAFYLWGLDRIANGARMGVLGDSGLPSGDAGGNSANARIACNSSAGMSEANPSGG